MTDQPAAIQATFADFRLIKGRKQAQLVLEIPIEEADNALAVLGGIPQPQSDCWVAVARLNGVAKPQPEPKEKQKWEDVRLSMQAGRRCDDKAFQKFLRDGLGLISVTDTKQAADAVRWHCGVDSRRGLNDNPAAAAKWKDLDRSYQAWLKAAE
jgi:hypothetical protein